MLYNLVIAPYKNTPTVHTVVSDDVNYRIIINDKESYIVGVTIENSDEGQCKTGNIVHNLHIGRYCSLSHDLHFLIGRGKDYTRVTVSAAKVFHGVRNELSSHVEKGSLIFENDIWVGSNASFMGGITIHNGAVVAAHSHVVKDVPPYAIVGGNPAKIIGYRFDAETIEALQTIGWWYWSDREIEERVADFANIQTFCQKYLPSAKQEIEQVCSKRNKQSDLYLMRLEIGEGYFVFPRVADAFIKAFQTDENKVLQLFILKEDEEKFPDETQGIRDSFDKMNTTTGIACRLLLKVLDGIEEAKDLMVNASHLIINRALETVRLMEYARIYGENIEIISGVDSPLILTKQHRGSSCGGNKTHELNHGMDKAI